MSKHRRRTPGNPKVRQALHQRGKPFLQLRPRKDLAETSMRSGAKDQMPARMIGQTGGNLLRITVAGQMAVDLSIHEAERVWNGAIERYFARRVA